MMSSTRRHGSRVRVLLALLVLCCVSSTLASEDLPLFDITTEDPIDHLWEIAADGDGYASQYELGTLFQSIQNKVLAAANTASAAADPHAGHAHAQDDAADDIDVSEATHMMSVQQIIAHYGTVDGGYMNSTQFQNACPALLLCAAEASCEFEHVEAEDDEGDDDSTKHLGLKLGILAGIFFLALFGGLAPLGIRNFVQIEGVLGLVNCFSGGVFMCAGLTHILPHVVEYGASVDGYGEYPLPYALVMLGYMSVFLVERVVFHIHKHAEEHDHEGGHGHGHGGHGERDEHKAHGHGHGHGHGNDHKVLDESPPGSSDESPTSSPKKHLHAHGTDPSSMDNLLFENSQKNKKNKAALYNSISVLIAISLHAVLAGISLGMQSESSRVIAVAVAICSHKAPAAFSVGSKFMRSGLPTPHVIGLVIAFTLVTPFGIVVGILAGAASPIAKLVLDGLAAGTFIYIGATEISTDEFEMTARACDKLHVISGSAKGLEKDTEQNAGVHTHLDHEPPSQSARLLAFSAYGAGVFLILMANLAPHAD